MMTEATDEQFEAAHQEFAGMQLKPGDGHAEWGRQMLAALQAHGCIPQQQGLTVRQELVARLVCSTERFVDGAIETADAILALGDAQ